MVEKEEQEKTPPLGKGRERSGQSTSQARENLNLHCVAIHKKSCKHNDSEVKENGLAITDLQRYHINANHPTKLHLVYFLPTSFDVYSWTRCSLVFIGLAIIPPLSLSSFI